MALRFEWDENKARINRRRHKGISFDEGKTIFNDPFLATYPDVTHSEDEQRYISIGRSEADRVLVVIHLDRGENIRLISCRKATAGERREYEEGSF